ncbi:long-chain fatty acid transport protein [Hoeflea sp. IMCC20628]|uniref:OmpP1/FadL family transporter n=1 Tax=Hoeflea sp. IMCC20628 TaxID=1620421 RepID=UPI00063AD303|nr:OmpP1/FadL family transporter [Hoeflea sp. IMCC20628]AKI00469.1 long-chain fatty acid transport protein [Hoeflea sp. IMCC20628]
MIRGTLKTFVALMATTVALASAAQAGGLERGGYNVDLLFDTSRFATEATATYVMPQRDLNNVVDVDATDGTPVGPANGVRETESYWVPRLGAKVGIGAHVDCMADYSQPYGAHSKPGTNWAGANSNTETDIGSDGFAATCSVKFQAGKGQLRVIGGVSHLEISGFKERLTAVIPAAFGTGIGRVNLEDSGIGWRTGIAYEIPEIAFRASAVYYSEVQLNSISGVLDLTQNPFAPAPFGGAVTPIFGAATMPQVVEIKVQSGIAPGWLAFGSVKWVDWSVLQSIALCPTFTAAFGCSSGAPNEVTSLDLYYRDGWTVTGGVGHKFNDNLSGLVALTWDRGTATTTGTQSDTWTVAAGGAFTPNENVEIRLGGALGVLTSGSSSDARITYNYGSDLVAAISGAVKVKF